MNTPGATATSTSKSTGTTSIHVGVDADYDWLIQIDIVWFWLTFSLQPDFTLNFKKQDTNNLNTPYDYSSIMHYGR